MNTNKEWFSLEWSKQGGLITPAIASKILRLSRQSIAQMTFKKISAPWGKTFLSYAEVIQKAEDRIINGVRRGRKRKINNAK